ncbi:MAG TPA: hypothetical protein VK556_03265, partial [Candidatus Udaeobacter sp.]|nr:hypothetical protein [Candidatus Udaeobacter sp.]
TVMKKIGILFGQEHSFPPAFVERVNQKTGGKDIVAEFVKIDKVIQGEPCGSTWSSTASRRTYRFIVRG